MNNFRAEIGEFHRLVVGQLVNDVGFRDPVRVCAHYPIDVGPDTEFAGFAECREDRCRVVAPIAPQRGL